MEQRQGWLKGEDFFGEGRPIYVNRAEESFQMEFHAHDFIEITYVAVGEGFHHAGEQVQPVRKGDLFVLPIGMPHVFRPASVVRKAPLAVYNCVFAESVLDEAALLAPELPLTRLLRLETAGSGAIIGLRDGGFTLEPIFQAMHDEYTARRPDSSAVLYSLLVRLLVELVRRLEVQDKQLPEAGDVIDWAVGHIRRHPDAELTIPTMARLVQVSERHFFRLFKSRTGQTFHEFVRHVRVQAGCRLLLETTHKIPAIAEAVGYKDLQSFNRVFKLVTGMTPGAFRKAGLLQS